jgi:hypothetical protein
VSEDENELVEGYEEYGGGASGSDDGDGLVEECSDSGTSEEYHSCSDGGSGSESGSGDDGEAATQEGSSNYEVWDEDVLMMWEEDMMDDMRAGWEELVREGGVWDRVQERDEGMTWERSAVQYIQLEYESLGDEYDDGRVNGREWRERAGQLVGFLGECSGRVEGNEERVRSREYEQMSRRRQARQERGEWLRGWEGEGQQSREELAEGEEREEEGWRESERKEEERQEEERQRQCREELVEEERRACGDEVGSQPRMRAWQRRGEGEWEWEGMERRRREESVARGELEREERKQRVADYERRHQERIRQVPDWQRRSWEKMERWLEESRGEEGQEEVRQMREEVKELRVVRRVLELELAEAEAAGRCVESVSEGVQCGWGSVGWERRTRGRGSRRARSEGRRWERQRGRKVWMCDGGWWEERRWEWGESGKLGGAGGLRRGLLFNGQGGYITCDVPIGEMEVLG